MNSTTRWFIDTNVIIYLKTDQDSWKRSRCEAWLRAIQRHGALLVSPQVINESATQLLRRAVGEDDRRTVVQLARELLIWCEARLDKETEQDAIDLYDRYKLSWWDSVLVSSAANARADYLLSEDMQDGQKLAGLEIVNPFRRSPEDVVVPRR